MFARLYIHYAATTNQEFGSRFMHIKQTIIHGRAEIWNFSSSVQRDIERVSVTNE